jgi:hypothetical protein
MLNDDLQLDSNFTPAEEGLPSGAPLLLQHVELCQAGLEADCAREEAALAAGLAAECAAPAAEAAAGAACPPAPGGTAAGADASGGGTPPWASSRTPSQWAMPLFVTLNALIRLQAAAGHVTAAGAFAAAHAFVPLAAHELATELPLPWGYGSGPTPREGAFLALEALGDLQGPPANVVLRSLLSQLADALMAAAAAVAAHIIPVGTPASAGTGACPDPTAQQPAAAAGAAHAGAATSPAPCTQPAETAQQLAPPPAAAHLAPLAIANMRVLATCVNRVNNSCIPHADLRPLLAPESPCGMAWAQAVARALATVLCWQEQSSNADTPGVPAEALLLGFKAATQLGSAAAELLWRFAAAGMKALQQEAGVQLMQTLAALSLLDPDVTGLLFEVGPLQRHALQWHSWHTSLRVLRPCSCLQLRLGSAVEAVIDPMRCTSCSLKHTAWQLPPLTAVSCGLQLQPAARGTFAKVGAALVAAIKAVLLTDEVHRGSEGRKQQRQQALAPLIGAACAGALAVTGKPCCCLHRSAEHM